jgi:O-antigen/teichoic acid export membrane protein
LLLPGEYSSVAALIAVTMVAAIPPVALETSLAREVALDLADGRATAAGAAFRDTLRVLRAWIAGGLVVSVVAWAVVRVGGDGPSTAVLATGVTIATALALPVAWGTLQGSGRFAALGLAQICFAGMRLVAGLVIAAAGGGAAAVMVGVALATLVTLVVSLLPLRGLWNAASAVVPKRRRIATRSNATTATGLTALTALGSADLVVARLAFEGTEAGAYAAAAIAARVLLLVPIGVTTVLFPHVAALRDPGRERQHLLAGLAVVAAAGAVAVAVLWRFAGPIVELVFGSDYSAAAQWLGPLALAMALFGLAWNYLLHFLSVGQAGFSIVLAGLFALQLGAFAAFHAEPSQLVAVQLATAALTLASAELWHLGRRR